MSPPIEPSGFPTQPSQGYLIVKSPVPRLLAIGVTLILLLVSIIWIARCGFNTEAVFLLVISIVGVGAGISWSLFGFDSLELRDKELVVLRDNIVTGRYPLSSIGDVLGTTSQTVVHVEGGKSIKIPLNWKNASEMATALRLISDANRDAQSAVEPVPAASPAGPSFEPAAAAEPSWPSTPSSTLPQACDHRRLRLPLHYVTFPEQCVCCSGPPEYARELSAARGFFGYFGYIIRRISVVVPLCRGCHLRRRLLGWVIGLSFLASVVLFIVGLVLVTKDLVPRFFSDDSRTLILIFVPLAAVLATPNVLMFCLGRFTDAMVLGVRVRRLLVRYDEVVLSFRKPELAAQVQRLTAETHREVITQVQEDLTGREDAQDESADDESLFWPEG